MMPPPSRPPTVGPAPAALPYAAKGPPAPTRRAVLRGLVTASASACVAGAYLYLNRARPLAPVGPPPAPAPAPLVVTPPGPRVDQIYAEAILPLLNDFNARNLAAARRAMVTLHERIAAHRAGIAPFTHEITSWKTRFGVLGRYSADAWNKVRGRPRNTDHVRAYVDGKFRRHVLSEEALKGDVAAVLEQFDEDMAASRNRLYVQLALPLARIRLLVPGSRLTPQVFRDDVQQRAAQITGSLPSDTLVAGMAAVAGGWVATDAAQLITTRIITQVLAQLGTTLAAEGIEAGGATVGSAVAGGGAGTLGGPAGTIIGVGVGLVVGAVVDWWLSSSFERKVADQCNRFLDAIEQRLRDGAPGSPGLWNTLIDTVNLTGNTQRRAVRDALKQESER